METIEGLEAFKNVNNEMLWKGAAVEQIKDLEAFAKRMGVRMKVVGSHHSKSIRLPVISFEIGGNRFFLRDNFYDINICVLASEPITLSLDALFEGILRPLDWDWYLEEMKKCEEYSWKGWSQEEIEDPRITRVEIMRADGKSSYFNEMSPERKERWLKRMTDPEWYRKDWSSGGLSWNGEFGPDVIMFKQPHPFMQGIEELVPRGASKPYEPGCMMFSIALGNLEKAETLIRRIP